MQGGGIARYGRCHTCVALASIGGLLCYPAPRTGRNSPEGRAAPGRATDGPTVAPPGRRAKGEAQADGPPEGRDARPVHGSRATTEPTKGPPADQRPKRAGKRAREGTPAPGRRGSPHAMPSGAPTAPPRAQQRGAEPFQTAAGAGRANRRPTRPTTPRHTARARAEAARPLRAAGDGATIGTGAAGTHQKPARTTRRAAHTASTGEKGEAAGGQPRGGRAEWHAPGVPLWPGACDGRGRGTPPERATRGRGKGATAQSASPDNAAAGQRQRLGQRGRPR